MKNTLYFSSIEEANQYFPSGVPSNVLAIVGDGSQVLVSSDNNNTTNQQYYSADLTNDEIVNEMVQTSYNEGHSNGYSEGYEGGYSYGYATGQTNGFYRNIYDVALTLQDMMDLNNWDENQEDVYISCIADNFTITDTNDNLNRDYEWDEEEQTVLINGVETQVTPHVTFFYHRNNVSTEWPTYFENFLDGEGDFIEDLYGQVFPVLSILSHQANNLEGQPQFICGGLVYENYVGDCMEEPEEITENGIYANNGQAYFDVNIASSSDITDNDFLGQIVNNTITAGYSSFVISDNTPDSSVLTDAFQAASSGLGVVYKASGDTLSTLPLYNPYDEETGSQTEIVYNDGSNVNSYYDWMASAPISLQVGDMLGFVVGSGSNVLWIAPFDGSEPFVCETAGNYTVLISSYTDDESGDTVWGLHIVPSTQLSGDYSNITNLNVMTMPINNGN